MNDERAMENHDALPTGVYLVEAWRNGEFVQHGVFSTSVVAKAWMNGLPEDHVCFCAPFVLDEPTFGNVRKEELH